MHCNDVADRIAAWVDQQLAPAECELLEAHLDRCAACKQLAASIAKQDLSPPRPTIQPPNWSRMDEALSAEMLQRDKRIKTPWHRRPYRISLKAGLTYAAALALAVSWGLHTHQQLEDSQQETINLRQALDRERRLAAEPSPMLVPYRLANHKNEHAPSRGTF